MLVLSSSSKNPYPPHGRSLEIPRGRGVLEAKILEAKYDVKLEFPGGRGMENKSPHVGGGWYGYFLEQHITAVYKGKEDIEIRYLIAHIRS